jgi:hypothetical protein
MLVCQVSTGHCLEQDTCIYTLLCLTDTVTSQNTDLSFWDTLHIDSKHAEMKIFTICLAKAGK